MIHNFSIKFASYLVENGAKQEREILCYGLECFINEVVSMGLLLLVGFATGFILELVIWSCSFCLLRVQIGGLHASTHGACFISGLLLGVSSLAISPFLLQISPLNLYITGVSLLFAIIIAPVPHRNKLYLQKKRLAIKKTVSIIAIMEFISLLILYSYTPTLATFVMAGILMAVILGMLGLIGNPK